MRSSSLLALVAAASLAACSSKAAPDDEPPMVASTQARITTPDVPAADAEALRAGNTAFAIDFYKQVTAGSEDNVFFSPYSISLALAMTYAGAKGETASQMATALHFTLPQAQLHPAFDGLDLALASRGQNAKGQDGKPFELAIANSLWGATDLTFGGPFLDTLAEDYGSGVRIADFTSNPDGARDVINNWVDKHTEDRIQNLLVPGAITRDTEFVLVNAIYLNASWAQPFDAAQAGVFHAAKGDVTTSLMGEQTEVTYAKGDGYQAVAIPYDGDELSLVAVMPDDFATFEKAFSADQAKQISDSLAPELANLTLPKFQITGASVSLKSTFEALGMTDAFDKGAADLTGISSTRLAIGDVIHKAFLSIDESGTEAAAATAVTGTTDSAGETPPTPIEVRLDHPFLFFIRDDATGAILFLGRFVQP